MDCLFCKIIKGDIPCEKLGETKDFFCFLDIKPISKGHALIVPKKHCDDFSTLPDSLGEEYVKFTKEMAAKITKAVKADGYNLGINNGAASGQVIFHMHTHIIPRFNNDGLKSWPHREATPRELETLKENIA